MMSQRSGDAFLGVGFNITSYALLVHMFCEVINNTGGTKTKLDPGRLIINLGDVHVYQDHYEQTIRQILRMPFKFPQVKFLRQVEELIDFKFEDIELVDYNCYPNIPAKM